MMTINGLPADRAQLSAMALRHLKPLGALWAGAGLAVVLGAAAQFMLARSLAPAGYGVIVTANSIANMLGPIAAFGVGLMLIQKHGSEGWRARRWSGRALRLSAVMTLTMIGVFFAWCFATMRTPGELAAAMLMAPFVAVFAGIQLAESRYQLEHDYVRVAHWQVMKHAGIFTVAVLTMLGGWTLYGAAAGLSIAALLTAGVAYAAGFGFLRRDFRLAGHGVAAPLPASPPPSYVRIAAEAWPFAATSFVFLFFFQSSLAVVHWLEGPESAGVYGLAVSVMTVFYLIPRVLYRKFFLAKVSRWYFQDHGRVAAFTWRIVPAIALLSLPIAATMALTAPYVIHLAFGSAYAGTAIILQIFALAVPFRFISAGLTIAAVETPHVRERVVWQFVIASIAVVSTILILPRAGIVGAAFVMTCAEVLLALSYGLMAWRDSLQRAQTPTTPVAPTPLDAP